MVLKRQMVDMTLEENQTNGHWRCELKCRGHDYRTRMVWFALSLASAPFLGLITFAVAISDGPKLGGTLGVTFFLFWYWILANYLNRIRIDMNTDHFQLSSLPIPWPDKWQIQTKQIDSFQLTGDRLVSAHASVFGITIAKVQGQLWDVMIGYHVDGKLRWRRLALGTTEFAEAEYLCSRLQQTLEKMRVADSC